MADNFYDFNHECDKMPDAVNGIFKLKSASKSQMTVSKHTGDTCFMATVYGLEWCPWCGEKLGGDV